MKVCLKKRKSMLTRIAKSFNDKTSSDFVVQCQGKEFYVHQYILTQQSEYFEGLLRNDCVESKEKKIVIQDFEPEVVEILLRYLYNGAVCWYDMAKNYETVEGVFRIADKYNFTELFDSLDSRFAQWNFHHLCSTEDTKLDHIKRLVQFMNRIPLPKTATLFFLWKSSSSHVREIVNDAQWSKLVLENPEFAKWCLNAFGRKDYNSWAKQHKHFFMDFGGLNFDLKRDENFESNFDNSCLIVGPLGDIEGAVECSSIFPGEKDFDGLTLPNPVRL